MSRWFRWYEGTTEDGKWRVVARLSRVTVRDVIALWAFMLEDAANLEHRGVCQRDEDFMSSVLDFKEGVVERILSAMQQVGLISVGHGAITICNWSKRQFESDLDTTAAERQRRKRTRDANTDNTPVTRDTATTDTESDTETDTDRVVVVDRPRVPRAKPRTQLPDGFPDFEALRRAQAFWTEKQRLDLAHSVREEAEQFRDHHLKHGSTMADWPAAWRTWCRNAMKFNRVERSHERKSNLLAGAELALAAVNRDGPGHHRGTVTVINPDGALGQSDEGGGGPALGRNVR